jgi:hypothetical protein
MVPKDVTARDSDDTYYAVQVGAYRVLGNAQATATRLGSVREDARIVKLGGGSAPLYVVVSGRFSVRDEARRLADDLGRRGFSTYVRTLAAAAGSSAAASAPTEQGVVAPTGAATGTTDSAHGATGSRVARPPAEAASEASSASVPPAAVASAPRAAPSAATESIVSPARRQAARRLIAGNPPPGTSLEDEGAAPEPSMELLDRLMSQPRRYDLVAPCL